MINKQESDISVCHITSAHNRYDDRIFYKECQSLSNVGIKVFLLVSDKNDDEVKNSINIVSNYCGQSRLIRIMTASKKMLRRALQLNCDIYHIHDPELLPLAYKLSKKGFRVVFDSHEFYSYQILTKAYIPAFIRGVLSKLYRMYENTVLSEIEAVVTPCTLNGKNYFESVAKKTVIIDNRPFKNLYKCVSNENELTDIKLCYAGGISESRGIVEMIQGAKLSSTKLILAGNIDDFAKKLIEESEYKDIVDYRGYQNVEGIQKIYNEASVGLAILHNEGQYGVLDNLPTKVYEYMLAGLAVIMTRRPYSERFIKKYPIGLLVDPTDINEISEAITYLKNNPKITKKMGESGRKAVIEDLCFDYEGKKLKDLYYELCEVK